MKSYNKKWLDNRVRALDRKEFWLHVGEIAVPIVALGVFWALWIVIAG